MSRRGFSTPRSGLPLCVAAAASLFFSPPLPSASAQPNPQTYLDKPQFLSTHGGYSFYKVYINPRLYRANQVITDDIISSTCLGASRGTPPMAPCASSSPACKYFSDRACKATSEEGCEQPMLTTSLAMQCSSAHDPACRLRAEGSLVGTNGGCLWAHMGGKWNDNGACGNCHCGNNAWNPMVATAAGNPRATCATLMQFCQKGKDYSVDGLIWNTCAPVPDPMGGGTFSCLAAPAPGAPWPATQMEHWAFCVGRAVCKCVHGKCDIASEQGNCQMGSCGPGWHGALCNLRCDPTYCNNRADPLAQPPAGVIASGFNGVWTTTENQCHCECLPQYGPSGHGGLPGTQCSECIQPGMLNCVPYVGTYLASTTPASSIPVSTQFSVAVDARFVQNDQVDSSLTEVITASKNPGGGNGDGGTLNVITQNSQLMQGRVTMVMSFSAACDACYITFKDTRGILRPLIYGPIRVTTSGTHLMALTSHQTVGVDDTVIVRLQAVDGPQGQPGKVDVTSTAVVTARLQTTPNGGNGGGCSINPDSASSLTQTMTSGKAEFRFKFGCACTACVIIFEDKSTTRTLPIFFYPPVKVTTAARSLGCRRAVGGDCQAFTVTQSQQTYSVVIRALDTQGNLDQTQTGSVTLTLNAASGGVLQNAAGTKSLTQPLVNGEAPYDLSFTRPCDNCIVTARHTDASITQYTFPTITVVRDAVNLAIANTVPPRVNVGQAFELVVEARDAGGFRDSTWGGNVGATLRPNGGNGNGGQLLNSDGTSNLVRTVVGGRASFLLKFTESCTSCIIEFTDVSASNARLNPTSAPGIFVGTNRVRLALSSTAPTVVQKGQPFVLSVRSVDALGNQDTGDSMRVTVRLVPNGGNGDGGTLTDPNGTFRDLLNGAATFSLTFSDACSQCMLEFTHASPDVPALRVGPIRVSSTATRLVVTSPVPRQVAANQPFQLAVQAVDAKGNIDLGQTSKLSLSVVANGNNGNGGALSNTGGLLQLNMVDGRATWNPAFSAACQACVLVVRDASGGILGQVQTDAITVATEVSNLILSPFVTLPSKVNAADVVAITVLAVDRDGNRAVATPVRVSGQLLPNGGNGDGNPFSLAPQTATTNAGEARFQAVFGGACTACVVRFAHNASGIALTLPAIEVRTEGRRMEIGAAVQSVMKGQVFEVPIKVVDDTGNLDTAWAGRVTASVQPGGGNGDGDPLTNAGQGLTQLFNKGKYTYTLAFGAPCTSCTIRFSDATGALPSKVMSNIKVKTTTDKLDVRQSPSGAATKKGAPFTTTVRALDIDGNLNTDDRAEVSMRMPNGQIVPGGEPKRLVNGATSFSLTMSEDCPLPCVLTPVYSPGTGSASDLTATPLRLPKHDNVVNNSDDSSSGLHPAVIVLLVILALLLLAALAYLLYRKLKGGKKPARDMDEDMDVKEEPSDFDPEPVDAMPVERVCN